LGTSAFFGFTVNFSVLLVGFFLCGAFFVVDFGAFWIVCCGGSHLIFLVFCRKRKIFIFDQKPLAKAGFIAICPVVTFDDLDRYQRQTTGGAYGKIGCKPALLIYMDGTKHPKSFRSSKIDFQCK
jgi:hypothetical protein